MNEQKYEPLTELEKHQSKMIVQFEREIVRLHGEQTRRERVFLIALVGWFTIMLFMGVRLSEAEYTQGVYKERLSECQQADKKPI